MPLATSVLHDDAVALLVLEGELDLSVASRVDRAVEEVAADGFTLLVVDVGHLDFCDSSGLGALMRASRTVCGAGGSCVVAGARGAVQRLFALTSMARVLTLSADVQPALVRLRRVAEDAGGS